MTSLSQQLRKLAAPETRAYRLKKKQASFLFETKEAAGIDRATFYQIGSSGFDELVLLNANFCQFRDVLFSDASTSVQRAVMSKDENEMLNIYLNKFLTMLMPYFTLKAAHKALEWLIHRFDIHEYNIDALFRCILPYHDSNLFVRMIQLSEFDDTNVLWYFLLPVKKNGIKTTRQFIVNHCATNKGFLKFLCQSVLETVENFSMDELENLQILFTFYASVICSTVSTGDKIDDAMVGQLLPNVLLGLKSKVSDYNIASLMILSQLVLKIKLTPDIAKAVLKQIFLKIRLQTIKLSAVTIAILFQTQKIKEIPTKTLSKLALKEKMNDYAFVTEIETLQSKTNVDKLIIAIVKSFIRDLNSDDEIDKEQIIDFLNKILDIKFEASVAKSILQFSFGIISNRLKRGEQISQIPNSLQQCCSSLARQYPDVFDAVLQEVHNENDSSVLSAFVKICNANFDGITGQSESTSLTLSLNHANPKIRSLALGQFFSLQSFDSLQNLNVSGDMIAEEIKKRMNDDNIGVLKVVVDNIEAISKISNVDFTVTKLISICQRKSIDSSEESKNLRLNILENLCKLDLNVLCNQTEQLLLRFLLPKLFLLKNKTAAEADIVCRSTLFTKFYINGVLLEYRNSLNSNDPEVSNTLLLKSMAKWLNENVKTRLPQLVIIDDKNDFSINRLLICAIICEALKNKPDFLLADELKRRLETYEIQDDLANIEFDDSLSQHLKLMQKSSYKLTRRLGLHFNSCLLQFYWNVQSLQTSKFWNTKADNVSKIVETVSLQLEILFGGISASDNSTQSYANELEGFLKTYFTDLTSLFKLSMVYLSSSAIPRFQNILIPMLNLLSTMIMSVKCETILKFLALGSPVPIFFIIALSTLDEKVRKSAAKCLRKLNDRITPNLCGYYANFLKFLNENVPEIQLDSNRLKNTMLDYSNSNKLGLASFTSIYKYFLSLDEIESIDIMVIGLEALSLCKNEETLKLCCDALETVLHENFAKKANQFKDNVSFEKYLQLLIEQFCCENGPLVLDESKYYTILKQSMTSYQNENFSASLAFCSLNMITAEFFESLPDETKCNLFEMLFNLKVGSKALPDLILQRIFQVLTSVQLKARHIVKFLCPVLVPEESDVPTKIRVKRKRTESSGSIDTGETKIKLSADHLKMLTFFLEIYSVNENAERCNDLMQPLFMAISIFMALDDKEASEYGIRLTLNCLESLCCRLEGAQINAKNFDVELLVRCIRIVEAPQSHQHAFRLLAVAAGVFKEELVVRLMPIFSFMGDNLFRQDDSYSFQIIERTIETVIPVLVSSSRDSKNCQQMLLKIYRDFVASAVHMPQHRRVSVLKKLILASKFRMDQQENDSNDETTSTPNNDSLWMLIGLLIEYHVTHFSSSKPVIPETDGPTNRIDLRETGLNTIVDFALNLCGEFDPKDQIICATNLLKYLLRMPEDIRASWTQDGMPGVFELKNKTDEQLIHFKYESLGLVSHILNSSSFVSQLGEMDEQQLESSTGKLCENLVEQILAAINTYSKSIGAKLNDPSKKICKAMLQRSRTCFAKFNALLPASITLNIINDLLKQQSANVQQCALEVLNVKLTQNPTPFTKKHVPNLSTITLEILRWLKKENLESEAKTLLLQSSLYTLKLLVRVACSYDQEPFVQALERIVSILHDWRQIDKMLLSNAVLCLSDLVVGLGVKTLPLLPNYVKDLLGVLGDEGFLMDNELLVVSILTALHKIVETMSKFLSPYITDILCSVTAISSNEFSDQMKSEISNRCQLIRKQLAKLPLRVLVPAIDKCLAHENLMMNKTSPIFQMLCDNVICSPSDEVSEHANELLQFIMTVFSSVNFEVISDIFVTSTIDMFCAMSLKLSENDFKPLITKLVEWSLEESEGKNVALKPIRKILLFQLANCLADKLKSLFTLFANPFVKLGLDMLNVMNSSKTSRRSFSKETGPEEADMLLRKIFDLVTKLCQYDTQGFLSRDKFDSLVKPVTEQIENTWPENYASRMENHVTPCLVSMAFGIQDDSAWKALNYEILLQTRSKKPKVRVAALKVIEKTYEKLGEGISVLIPESVTFLAELMEDECEDVEMQCQRVVKVLESIVGESLKDYF